MAAESLVTVLLHNWPAVLGIAFTAYILSNRYHNGLNKYPGPFLASLTDWWRFWIVYKRRPEVEHIKLHEKHGNIVRLGPNSLSFSDPKVLKTIYGLNKGFTKVRILSRFCSLLIEPSPNSTQFNKLLHLGIDFRHYSVPLPKPSMRSSAAASTALFRCPR